MKQKLAMKQKYIKLFEEFENDLNNNPKKDQKILTYYSDETIVAAGILTDSEYKLLYDACIRTGYIGDVIYIGQLPYNGEKYMTANEKEGEHLTNTVESDDPYSLDITNLSNINGDMVCQNRDMDPSTISVSDLIKKYVSEYY